MDDPIETGVQQALARTVLEKSSHELREALLAEVWHQHREALAAQALEAVREEHAHELAASEEALKDRFTAQRKALERELSQQEDVIYQKLIQDFTEDYADRIGRLKATRDAWKSRATAAEAQLVFLIEQLLHETHKKYLRDSGVEKLDLVGLNAVLAPHGWAIRAAARPSERTVVTMVAPGRPERRHVFWLVRVDPERAPVEDDEDEETPALPLPQGT